MDLEICVQQQATAGNRQIFAPISLQNLANWLAVTLEFLLEIAYSLVKSFLTADGQSRVNRGMLTRLRNAVVKLLG